MELKQVDKELLDGFALWQKHTYDMHRDNVNLGQEKELLQLEQDKLKSEVDKHSKLLHEANSTIAQLQHILTLRCDMEDENRVLKRDIADRKNKLLEAEQAHQTKLEAIQKEMEDAEQDQKAKFQAEKAQLNKQVEEEKHRLMGDITMVTKHLEEAKARTHQLETDHQAEIMHLRFEYDSKMLKLQKQNARIQQQPPGGNQEIFRKKLLHMRVETDREISSLKHQVAELEEKVSREADKPRPIARATARPAPPQHQAPTMASNAKRIRRY